jgi:3-oxoacyl-[acyl-carrier-protein] synthase-3
LGLSQDRQRGHLDYGSWAEAETDGALSLRQDIRLLPHLFDIGIHEYAQLVRDGWVDPARIDHFLCHYSSEKFIPVVQDLMDKAGLAIPRERWYSNLAWRGNTGAASMLIMLAEFLETRQVQPGQQIFCYIPESGRFTTAYMLLEVEAGDASDAAGADARKPERAFAMTGMVDGMATTAATAARAAPLAPVDATADGADAIEPPHDPQTAPAGLGGLLTELAGIWHDYRSRVWRTPLLRQLRERRFATTDYLNWMAQWVPQVREGSKWMREGAASLTGPYQALAALIGTHAGEEQDDFKILYRDYRGAGGQDDIDALRRNPGGEALNAYLHALAATSNPLGLLGAIYIIEGTGQRIVPALLPLLKASLDLPPDVFRFLEYHGHNDENHLNRWLAAVEIVMALDERGDTARQILDTARSTAALYLMQFQYVTEARREATGEQP